MIVYISVIVNIFLIMYYIYYMMNMHLKKLSFSKAPLNSKCLLCKKFWQDSLLFSPVLNINIYTYRSDILLPFYSLLSIVMIDYTAYTVQTDYTTKTVSFSLLTHCI